MSGFLKPEDYKEPVCPLCDDPFGKKPKQIPMGRVIGKLDEHVAKKEIEAALRHIDYWISEAREGRDTAGVLTLLNEKMGVLRKEGRHEEAIKASEEALALAALSEFENDPVSGTTCLNAATVRSAAGQPEEALPLYERAERIYLALLDKKDRRFAGLYNNMAVVLAHLGRYEEARADYEKALTVQEALEENTCLDRAVTYANLANLYEMQFGLEEGEAQIALCLTRAKELLDDESVGIDAYAAFVFEKCAPTFSYYGWFAYAEELNERAGRFYEGT